MPLNNEKRIIDAVNDPVCYPWKTPDSPGVLIQYNPDSSRKSSSIVWRKMILDPNRRVSSALVDTGSSENTSKEISIERFADELGASGVDQRFLVVAVGSNANLEVLGNKLYQRAESESFCIPYAPAIVTNMSVGYFADMGMRGYIAATPFDNKGAKTLVWAAWLSTHELKAMDSTEPGYTRRWVSAKDYPLEILTKVPSSGGAIRDISDENFLEVADRPLNYFIYDADVGVIKDKNKPLLLRSQREIFSWISDQPSSPKEFTVKNYKEISEFYSKDTEGNNLAEVKQRCDDFRRYLKENDLVSPTGIKGRKCEGSASHDMNEYVYSNIQDAYWNEKASLYCKNTNTGKQNQDYYCVVRCSAGGINRRGEQSAIVNPQLAHILGKHARIVFQPDESSPAREFIVRIHADYDIEENEIHLDQKARHAIGVRIGETIAVSAIRCTGFKAKLDNVVAYFMPTRYLPVRVQYADLLNAESDVVLADPRVMSFLGSQNGDSIVLEGINGSNISSIRMRVVEADQRFLDEREVMCARGGTDARFASSDKVLRVYPDIPAIFVDKMVREALGVDQQVLMPLRVRPSRRQKIFFELRELLLVLAISLIGLISVIESAKAVVFAFASITLVAVIVSLLRVRAQIGVSYNRLC